MADHEQTLHDRSAVKDPADWVTGAEPMTGAQDSYLHTLAREAGVEVADDLTKAEASAMIEELRHDTGRDAVPTQAPTPAAAVPKAKAAGKTKAAPKAKAPAAPRTAARRKAK